MREREGERERKREREGERERDDNSLFFLSRLAAAKHPL